MNPEMRICWEAGFLDDELQELVNNRLRDGWFLVHTAVEWKESQQGGTREFLPMAVFIFDTGPTNDGS